MKMRQGSRWALAATALFALLIAIPAFAKGTPNPNNGRGKITAVSATSITVQPKDGAAKTYAITSTTKIKLDKKAATAADLMVNYFANVKSDDGSTALRINARKHHGHKKGADTAGASLF